MPTLLSLEATRLLEPDRMRELIILFQDRRTIFRSFFSSYQLTESGWTYAMGNFALQAHPLVDQVEMVVQPKNGSKALIFTVSLVPLLALDSILFPHRSLTAPDLALDPRTLPTTNHGEPKTVKSAFVIISSGLLTSL